MPWLRLEMQVEAPVAEALSDALLELGAQSVTIEDARTDTPEEMPRFGEPGMENQQPWHDSRVSALIEVESDARSFIEAASSAAGLPEMPGYGVTRIDDEDWVRRTQSQFGPLHVGERLWIVPSWSEQPASKDAVIIRLDPGLAFGTGSHPTTRLMLAWIETAVSGWSGRAPSVLDYGCGSGILALAAAKLGASEVVAIDLDPRALDACAHNALANSVSMRIEPPERLPDGNYELVIANILARPLIDLAPVFAVHTTADAQIALAGVLAEQAEEVIAAYEPQFEMRIAAIVEGWALLAGKRR